jgi:hypothetical protein
MFANIFRTQARIALASCRTRASMTSVAAQLVARRPAQPFLIMSRPLSTSRMVQNEYESDGYSRQAPVKKDPSNTLYIGNLPYSVEDQDLREKFEAFGTINQIRIGERPSFFNDF